MGLDIAAYSKLVLADAPSDETSNHYFRAYVGALDFTEKNWPGHTCGIKPGVYTFDKCFSFHAGSYSGYGNWRRWLARIAGWQSIEDCWNATNAERQGLPFSELLHFADNEGVIGAKVAAKLASDFANYDPIADTEVCRHWEYEQYNKWQRAFELAADDGAVDFR